MVAVILRRQEGTRHMQRGRCSVHALAGMGALVWRRLVYTALCRAPRGGAHNRKVVERAQVHASRPANVCHPSATMRAAGQQMGDGKEYRGAFGASKYLAGFQRIEGAEWKSLSTCDAGEIGATDWIIAVSESAP